ncbi:pyruvate kinase [Megasphaera sp. NM10]|nr:pyruvate kinase [Megasphaera sp. NM10]
MLNKGPYIVEAVTVLTNILQRMEQHQYKKNIPAAGPSYCRTRL